MRRGLPWGGPLAMLQILLGAAASGRGEEVPTAELWASLPDGSAASATEMTLSFRAFGFELLVDLIRNRDIVSGAYKHIVLGKEGYSSVREAAEAVQKGRPGTGKLGKSRLDCYYHGSVRGSTASWVALDTCSGSVRGLVVAGDRRVSISSKARGGGGALADGEWLRVLKRESKVSLGPHSARLEYSHEHHEHSHSHSDESPTDYMDHTHVHAAPTTLLFPGGPTHSLHSVRRRRLAARLVGAGVRPNATLTKVPTGGVSRGCGTKHRPEQPPHKTRVVGGKGNQTLWEHSHPAGGPRRNLRMEGDALQKVFKLAAAGAAGAAGHKKEQDIGRLMQAKLDKDWGPHRRKLQGSGACSAPKHVALAFVNDYSRYSSLLTLTESNTLAVFNAMQAFYTTKIGGGNCMVTPYLMGQVSITSPQPNSDFGFGTRSCDTDDPLFANALDADTDPCCSEEFPVFLEQCYNVRDPWVEPYCLKQTPPDWDSSYQGCFDYGEATLEWKDTRGFAATVRSLFVYSLDSKDADEIDTMQYLNSFQRWAEVENKDALQALFAVPGSPQTQVDSFVLVSRENLAGIVVGLASINGMCSLGQSSFLISSSDEDSSATDLGVVAAHELGHALGMRHDGSSTNYPAQSCTVSSDQCSQGEPACLCPSCGYVMAATLFGTPELGFSLCSGIDTEGFMSTGYLETNQCLEDQPPVVEFDENGQRSDSTAAPTRAPDAPTVCGDGILEGIEECEALADGKTDPCCDLTVCRLKAGCECLYYAPNGEENACCREGMIEAGVVCRAAAGPCDAAELCQADHAACPPDLKYPARAPCVDLFNSAGSGMPGTCYQNSCVSMEKECLRRLPDDFGRLSACVQETETCGQLQCLKSRTQCSAGSMRNGMLCGTQGDQVCIGGQCLSPDKADPHVWVCRFNPQSTGKNSLYLPVCLNSAGGAASEDCSTPAPSCLEFKRLGGLVLPDQPLASAVPQGEAKLPSLEEALSAKGVDEQSFPIPAGARRLYLKLDAVYAQVNADRSTFKSGFLASVAEAMGVETNRVILVHMLATRPLRSASSTQYKTAMVFDVLAKKQSGVAVEKAQTNLLRRALDFTSSLNSGAYAVQAEAADQLMKTCDGGASWVQLNASCESEEEELVFGIFQLYQFILICAGGFFALLCIGGVVIYFCRRCGSSNDGGSSRKTYKPKKSKQPSRQPTESSLYPPKRGLGMEPPRGLQPALDMSPGRLPAIRQGAKGPLAPLAPLSPRIRRNQVAPLQQTDSQLQRMAELDPEFHRQHKHHHRKHNHPKDQSYAPHVPAATVADDGDDALAAARNDFFDDVPSPQQQRDVLQVRQSTLVRADAEIDAAIELAKKKQKKKSKKHKKERKKHKRESPDVKNEQSGQLN